MHVLASVFEVGPFVLDLILYQAVKVGGPLGLSPLDWSYRLWPSDAELRIEVESVYRTLGSLETAKLTLPCCLPVGCILQARDFH